ncbi:manganese/zinc/iron transport system permease protein [Cytobacillus horneckiae]|uniref:Metal ABC transporter permease n=1 Tax=Cytobacillus horneckiae TaxID=549687 RepID=A0A2N0ZKN5_9BACI|nr:metal ABC transporter permease [Cytobacillus horneckiae]MBN6888533.1 metal ABC transporter permease [Cytobacillus horneckiae]MCM3180328.1 metal ABC transporter permease [Cytobacillus horneckiae]MEC1156425.1 metal ABC transporter permease [Cytobacillus horneckiae]MED2938442.1 metal ABC transporter permease [Cytobacillus horneckiae]PKG30053.1 metal ABC transporter permease [Cytobacillus horneckiae]
MSYEAWILIIGSMAGITCGVVGCFLILRKLSMLADAISHTVLLGIVLAFLISQSMNGLYMLIGAAAVGLLTAVFVQLLHSSGIQEDASIGVVFTFLFAIGVILITIFADNVHLDVDHALMGEIAFVPFDLVQIGFLPPLPKAFLMLASVLIINLVIIVLFYKEFKITSFDPQMAAAIGIPVLLIHYLLMGMVSITTVASFDSVGAILVVAMLIAPGASAYLLTNKLSVMLLLSAVFGVIAAVVGYYAASYIDASISGCMAMMNGIIFLLVFLFSPSKGILSKRLPQKKLHEQIGK